MTTKPQIHEATIRPSLVAELEAFRAPGQLVSSYYLDLRGTTDGDPEAEKLVVKNALAEQRERLEQLDLRPAVRHALKHDWEQVQELALLAVGRRATRSLACFVASAGGYARALPLPWPTRSRAFFEDRFVLWPLHLLLDQADRYAICLTDKDDARLFLFYMERIEEVASLRDEIPGRIRFRDPIRQWHYANKHVEHFYQHFENVAEATLRLLQREPFEHLIIGGLWEHLPEFEESLHRYLRGRIVARWDIDVHTPTPQVLERAIQEEQNVLRQQARDIWKSLQDHRLRRGALGPEETFAALWRRGVQAMLVEPEVGRAGHRCQACGRLQTHGASCVECGGATAEVADAYEEAVDDAIEQSALVRFWKDPALNGVGSIAALKRF